MLTQEIIRIKRDGGALPAAAISSFIKGITEKTVGEGQMAAFCMAVLLRKMTKDERVALTMAMARSGTTLDWASEKLNGPVLDKHSTGGVGDKISLMLAPLIAACGGYVPMISGRGLGHTGGTLDKMDSIPGYVSQPPLDLIKKAIHEAGCAVIGATSDVAPADRALYAVRDVTATVESLDLITASILSKKLAAGLGGLVMDVKFGSGAFMQKYEDATALARSIVDVANGAGLPCTALMTDMNQVLGRTAGNAIEVRESIEFLRGEKIDPRLREVTIALSADLLVTGKLAKTPDEARRVLDTHLSSGKAAEIFGRMVTTLGGPADIIDNYKTHLPLAPVVREVTAPATGYVHAIDVRTLGLSIIELGGGRRLVTDKIDHSVGLEDVAAPGDRVGPGAQALARIYARTDTDADRAATAIQAAFTINSTAPRLSVPPVRERLI